MYWIGIDPGKSGGIAVVSDNYEVGDAYVVKMPETGRDLFDEGMKIKKMITDNVENTDMFCLIENVHAFPGKQGVSSTFKFGYHFGLETMLLTALKIPHAKITPRTWQKAFTTPRKKDMSTTAWKNLLKGKAQELYPHVKITLALSDALLIAHYNRYHYQKNVY